MATCDKLSWKALQRDHIMRTEDLKTLAEIGRAIWTDPTFSERTTVETVAAVTLLHLPPERTVERAASVLLDRATRESHAGHLRKNFNSVTDPFFRLSADQRFLLVALHLGRWSYARLARILEEEIEKVEELAWTARVELIAQASTLKGSKVPYPAGAGVMGRNCPEYRADRPWTQRFLDEEIHSGNHRLFLQNHLMACDSCRNALSRCREVYFAVEAMIPKLETGSASSFVESLGALCTKSQQIRNGSDRTFLRSLGIFVQRIDVQIALAIMIFALVIKVFGI